jgi:ergothioneine biosynthesis protein EgtB
MANRIRESAPAARHAAQRFQAIRAVTRALAAPLTAEDCAIQSMTEASPVKWHLAHTTWFFETFILSRHDPQRAPFDPAFRVLFNSYYNAVGERHPRPQRGLLSRPDLAQVLAYRDQVDEEVSDLLERDVLAPELRALVELGMNHEQQHQELILTDLKHMLSCNRLARRTRRTGRSRSVGGAGCRWSVVCAIGTAAASASRSTTSSRLKVWIEPFEIASMPVTHAELIDFIEDGGYRRPELWLYAGWDTAASRGWTAPMYWERRGGRWYTFTLHGMAPVERNTPACNLSFYEADALARWAGARLPAEAEWECAADGVPVEGNFLESGALHPLALREPAPRDTPAQMFGDVWEWTRSDYSPYPRFRPAPGAVGEYNGKFMCNQYVLRGGSCATPGSHIRPTYRNFFAADARWQFSGLRLARDA